MFLGRGPQVAITSKVGQEWGAIWDDLCCCLVFECVFVDGLVCLLADFGCACVVQMVSFFIDARGLVDYITASFALIPSTFDHPIGGSDPVAPDWPDVCLLPADPASRYTSRTRCEPPDLM